MRPPGRPFDGPRAGAYRPPVSRVPDRRASGPSFPDTVIAGLSARVAGCIRTRADRTSLCLVQALGKLIMLRKPARSGGDGRTAAGDGVALLVGRRRPREPAARLDEPPPDALNPAPPILPEVVKSDGPHINTAPLDRSRR
jgi:hypothetical protein